MKYYAVAKGRKTGTVLSAGGFERAGQNPLGMRGIYSYFLHGQRYAGG